jgi:hypothetical protein
MPQRLPRRLRGVSLAIACRAFCAAPVALCITLAASSAHAQALSDGDKAAARQLTIDGHAALERKEWAVAADLYARADKLFHAPTVTLGLARSQVGLGKLVSAQELYNRLIHEPLPPNPSEAFTRALEDGHAELTALALRIPSLIIIVKGTDGPKVTLDGVDVQAALLGIKRPVDPGKHTVHAIGRRSQPKDVDVTLAEGKVETVTLELVALPDGAPDSPGFGPGGAPPPGLGGPVPAGPVAVDAPAPDAQGGGSSVRKPVGIAFVAAGGAGLLIGAITGGLAASKRSSLVQQCPSGHCSSTLEPTLQPQVNTLDTMATASTIGFVAGGIFAATGVILLVTAPKSTPTTTGVVPLIGPGFLGLRGRY